MTDRGIGIAPEHQKRVFERFFRVDPARSRATGGTGLGLAIVKHVLANHGGEVRLWSSPGTGSTFTMRLPARASPARSPTGPTPRPTQCPTRAGRPDAPARRRARPRRVSWRTSMTRVLIVEDEESFADPLAFLLRKEGFTTAIAGTGQDALEEFDRNGADIVLLDLMLPGMSGTDVCKALRTRSAVPVIMVTARDSEIDKVVGLELGRRRLRDQALLGPRADRQGARGAAPRRRRRRRRRRPARRAGGRARCGWTSSGTSCRSTARTWRCRSRSSTCWSTCCATSAGCSPAGQLIDRVWGADYVGDTKTLDVHVKRLRSKVEADPSVPRHLVTVRGLGYKFES